MIDGGIFIGRNPSTGAELTMAQLETHLSRHGVSGACVTAYRALCEDTVAGNDELLELCRNDSRLYPVAALDPSAIDTAKLARYLDRLRANGFVSVGLFGAPSYNGVDFASPIVERTCREASERGFITHLGLCESADLARILPWLGQLRSPVMIRWMRGRSYRAMPLILETVERCPGALFDVGALTTIGAIRVLADRAGASRLFMASNAPESEPLCASFLVQASGLTTSQRHEVFIGTLARTLAVSADPAIDPGGPADALYEELRTAKKWDTHWHLEGWNLIEPCKSDEELIDQMQRCGIERAIFSSIRALNGGLVEGNAHAFEMAARTPGAYALVVVDPLRADLSISQIRRYAAHPKCVGIKTIQDLYGARLSDRRYEPILDEAAALELTIMAHLPGMSDCAAKRPRTRFVAAHVTHGRIRDEDLPENVYCDIATSQNDRMDTDLAGLIDRVGEDRVLFASDAQLMHPAWTLGKLAGARLTSSQLHKILRLNAQKAFPRLIPN